LDTDYSRAALAYTIEFANGYEIRNGALYYNDAVYNGNVFDGGATSGIVGTGANRDLVITSITEDITSIRIYGDSSDPSEDNDCEGEHECGDPACICPEGPCSCIPVNSYTVSGPADDPEIVEEEDGFSGGYTVTVSAAKVKHGESYTFTLTFDADAEEYNGIEGLETYPEIWLKTGNGNLSATVTPTGDSFVYTYTIENVTGDITVSDFEVGSYQPAEYIIEAPINDVNGKYTIGAILMGGSSAGETPRQNEEDYVLWEGETFTFTVTVSAGYIPSSFQIAFEDAYVTRGEITYPENRSEATFTVTVSNVRGDVLSGYYEITAPSQQMASVILPYNYDDGYTVGRGNNPDGEFTVQKITGFSFYLTLEPILYSDWVSQLLSYTEPDFAATHTIAGGGYSDLVAWKSVVSGDIKVVFTDSESLTWRIDVTNLTADRITNLDWQINMPERNEYAVSLPEEQDGYVITFDSKTGGGTTLGGSLHAGDWFTFIITVGPEYSDIYYDIRIWFEDEDTRESYFAADSSPDPYDPFSKIKFTVHVFDNIDVNDYVVGRQINVQGNVAEGLVKNEYDVTFYDPINSKEISEVKVLYGEMAERPEEDPPLEGYRFVRWETTGGAEFDFDTEIYRDYTILATWEQIRYSFKVDARDEDHFPMMDIYEYEEEVSPGVFKQGVVPGDPVYMENIKNWARSYYEPGEVFVREGYLDPVWYVRIGGVESEFDEHTFLMPESDAVLFAKWPVDVSALDELVKKYETAEETMVLTDRTIPFYTEASQELLKEAFGIAKNIIANPSVTTLQAVQNAMTGLQSAVDTMVLTSAPLEELLNKELDETFYTTLTYEAWVLQCAATREFIANEFNPNETTITRILAEYDDLQYKYELLTLRSGDAYLEVLNLWLGILEGIIAGEDMYVYVNETVLAEDLAQEIRDAIANVDITDYEVGELLTKVNG
jgi:hypothetical protein